MSVVQTANEWTETPRGVTRVDAPRAVSPLPAGAFEPTPVSPLVIEVISGMRDDLEGVARSITTVIHDACPDLPASMFDATFASTLANVDAITLVVRDGTDPAKVSPPDDAKAYARMFARSGLDMELLTRAYRYGEHSFRQNWMRDLHQIAAGPDDLSRASIYFEDRLFRYISSITGLLAAYHAEEHERRTSRALILRANEVRTILSGAQIDDVVSSQRLRYRLDGWHVGFVLWHEGHAVETEDSLEELGRLAAATSASIGATNTLALPFGDVYAAWANVSNTAGLNPDLYPPRVHVAFGLPQRGCDGFRRTHQEALHARRVVTLAGSDAPLAGFAELALDALLTTDIDEATRFVSRQLGELMEQSGPRERIIETLETYLITGSLARASRQLGVHENTVAYRLRRAEEMLGHPIDEHQLELQSALRLARLLRRPR